MKYPELVDMTRKVYQGASLLCVMVRTQLILRAFLLLSFNLAFTCLLTLLHYNSQFTGGRLGESIAVSFNCLANPDNYVVSQKKLIARTEPEPKQRKVFY